MSAQKSPLVNKLILLALGLILACLVVLIAQQNAARREAAPSTVAQIVTEENSPPELREPPAYLPLTNRTAPKAANNATQPVAPEVSQRPPVRSPQGARSPVANQTVSASLVNLPSPSHSETPVSSVGGGHANGAEIAGYVWLNGTPPAETPISLDATCRRLHSNPIMTRHYVTTEGGALANVFVYIKNAPQDKRVPTNAVVLDNVACLFEPYVLGVQAGQKIQFRNSDLLMHNVHATTRVNHEFNFALPGKDQSVEKTFRVPEVFVRVKCDVHPWMFAYIGVVTHPFFAVTDHEGIYRLPRRVPRGNYTIVAIHAKAGEVSQEVTVRDGESLRLDFTLTVPASGP